MSNLDVVAALQRCASVVPSPLQQKLKQFQELYEERLWHQLTEQVQAFYNEGTAKNALPTVFSQFISIWHKKMNPIVYVKLAIETARQLQAAEALSLLETVVEEMKSLKQPESSALVALAMMEAAQYKLRLGDMAGAKSAIETCADVAESYAAIDPVIPATFFRVCADYDKAMISFASFYRNALLYLACMKMEEIPLAEAQERAHDLCIAALLGDTIYNFAELLSHPILNSLADTPFAFLQGLLFGFNAGNMEILKKHSQKITQHPTLASHGEFLRQKLCMMALVEAIFRHLKSSRTIPFSVISQSTGVPLEQVEFLLMKGLSVKLIRGTIQEPEKQFETEWVQPRVLDMEQLAELRKGLQAWRGRVRETAHLINSLLPESLAATANAL